MKPMKCVALWEIQSAGCKTCISEVYKIKFYALVYFCLFERTELLLFINGLSDTFNYPILLKIF